MSRTTAAPVPTRREASNGCRDTLKRTKEKKTCTAALLRGEVWRLLSSPAIAALAPSCPPPHFRVHPALPQPGARGAGQLHPSPPVAALAPSTSSSSVLQVRLLSFTHANTGGASDRADVWCKPRDGICSSTVAAAAVDM
jgi:hypothetical protein